MPQPDFPITKLLKRVGENDPIAADDLARAVHTTLRRQAALLLRQHRCGDLDQPTSLINEFYAKPGWKAGRWDNREQFFAFAFRAMKNILVDEARRRTRVKRGGGAPHLSLDQVPTGLLRADEDTLLVRDAYSQLLKGARQEAVVYWMSVVEDMTETEIASALSISRSTVQRHKKQAGEWLLRELTDRQSRPDV